MSNAFEKIWIFTSLNFYLLRCSPGVSNIKFIFVRLFPGPLTTYTNTFAEMVAGARQSSLRSRPYSLFRIRYGKNERVQFSAHVPHKKVYRINTSSLICLKQPNKLNLKKFKYSTGLSFPIRFQFCFLCSQFFFK